MLGLVGFAHQFWHGLNVFTRIDTVLFLECFGNEVNDAFVPVNPSQVNITCGGDGVESPPIDFHNGDVKGATAQVVNQDGLGMFTFTARRKESLLHAVADCRRSGFIDDVQDIQPGQSACVLSGFPAGLIEKGWDRDDGLLDIAKGQFGVFFQFAQDQRLDHFGGQVFATDSFFIIRFADVSFGKLSQTVWFQQSRLNRFDAHNRVLMIEKHSAGRGQVSLCIADRFWTAIGAQVGNCRECGS